MFTPRAFIWCCILCTTYTYTYIINFIYIIIFVYVNILNAILFFLYINIYWIIYIYIDISVFSPQSRSGEENSMRNFGVPLQWGEKVFSGPFGCGYHVCQSKQLLRCFDSFRCLQHGCAFGKSTTLIQFLFIRSSNLEYHPKLLIYHYVKLIYHYVKSECINIYICNHYYFIPLHIAIHLDARSSGQCALRCQAGGVLSRELTRWNVPTSNWYVWNQDGVFRTKSQ